MLKVQILCSLAVLMCGQILFWRRRDNLFGYQQVGLYVASVFVPVVGTSVLDDMDRAVVQRYATILLVGAVAHTVGMLYGASIGFRCWRPRVNFDAPFPAVPRVLLRRVRLAACAALAALVAAFALLGYIPLLASDRVSAKYGVGAYQAGFARGATVYHVALALAGAVLALLCTLVAIRRRRGDVVLLAGIGVGLLLTLSRGQALAGPFAFLIAWGIQQRWKPWKLVAVACVAFIAGALVNQLTFSGPPTQGSSFASDVAASAPDVHDQLGFLDGFRRDGDKFVGTRTIAASLEATGGEWDPSGYALRTLTGLTDVRQLASGGLRLPAPVWGYVSYGFVGVVVWSFISGLFIGWGTTLLRRLLAGVQGARNQSLNLILAWIFFNGTFDVLAGFFFFERSSLLLVALAGALCWVRGPKRAASAPPHRHRTSARPA